MQELGTTQLSTYGLTDEEFAARLVRPSKRSDTGAAGPSFRNTLASTVGEAGRSAAGEARKTAEDKRLRDACVEMESLFVGKMLKEMRKTVHKSGWINGGFAEEIFEDMLYDEYALSLSKNSNLGLANMLYSELSQKR
ncbi:MAG: cell division protein [Chrysiogenales bacterium]|nr:MAG: cell division protein [Chrysiogenales bacterium]